MIARLIAEVKAGRELTAEQRGQIDALAAQLKAEQANTASLTKSYELAEREIASLRQSVEFLQTAIKLHEQTVAILTNDNGRLKKEAHKARKQAAVAGVVAVLIGAAKIFL